MNKLLFSLCAVLGLMGLQAQESFSYQSVIRDANNDLVTNQSIGVQLTIRAGSATAAAVYVEQHNATSNANGLITLEVGQGAVQSGSMSAIDWGSATHFLSSEFDLNGGTAYTLSHTQQLLSVPYALHALKAGNAHWEQDSLGVGYMNGQVTVNGVQLNEGGWSNIATYDTLGRRMADLGRTSQDAGAFTTRGPNGTINHWFTHFDGFPNSGYFGMPDSNGVLRLGHFIRPSSNGGVSFVRGQNGSDNAYMSHLWADPNFGVVGVVDSTNAAKAELLVFENGTGNVLTWGANGSVNVHLGSAYDNGDGGMVNIQDGQNNVVAAMEVDSNGNGVLWATIKNFRVDHPKDPNKEIWYGSLEGAELGAYYRGTAQLSGGEATVTLPEEFTLIANLQTMTIMLTPLDASSKGLAVVEKTASGFKVKELHNGDGNYALDWEVKAKRLGYEDFKVIRDRPAQSDIQKYGVERKTRKGLPSDDLPDLVDPASTGANPQK